MGYEPRRAPGGMTHLGPAPTVSVPVDLQAHLQDGRPEPEYQIRLCFGEEYPAPADQPQERLIMAHVSHLPTPVSTPSSPLLTPLTAPSSPSSAPDLLYDPLICMTLLYNVCGEGAIIRAVTSHRSIEGGSQRKPAHGLPFPPCRWSQSLPESSSCTRSTTTTVPRWPGPRRHTPDGITHSVTQLSQP